MSTEVHYNFSIKIILPDGTIITDRQLAVSTYHAIDKSITRYGDKQSDRSKYTAKKPIIRVR